MGNRNIKQEKGWVRPLIAVAGFFVILFLSAYLVYRFHLQWLIPVGIIVAIVWAILFSMDRDKKN